MNTRSDDVAKWTSIISGAVTVAVAVPSFTTQNPIVIYSAIGTGLVTAAATAFSLRRSPYDVEFLDHVVELDIHDEGGKDAKQTRHTRIRALRKGIETVTDHMSADGEMSEVSVSPGVVKQVRREGGDLFITSSLGKVLAKGETVDRVVTIDMKDTFVNPQSEYWSVRIHHPMGRFTLRIVFPRAKNPKAVRGLLRVSTYERPSDVQPVVAVGSDGRSTLVWTVQDPSVKDVYKAEWDW